MNFSVICDRQSKSLFKLGDGGESSVKSGRSGASFYCAGPMISPALYHLLGLATVPWGYREKFLPTPVSNLNH